MSPRWITCREFLDFLWAYLSEEVTAEERAEFENHLSGCPSCVAYMKTYQDAIRLGREALRRDEEPVPTDLAAHLVQAMLAARKP